MINSVFGSFCLATCLTSSIDLQKDESSAKDVPHIADDSDKPSKAKPSFFIVHLSFI
jgi:hypothetical protein